MKVAQNTLYLMTPETFVTRDHLTLRIEIDHVFKLAVPIHHLEAVCVFGPNTVTAPALALCWEHGVAVNFLNEWGRLQARLTGVADTSVTLRRTQFRAADDRVQAAAIARQIVAGKIQNARQSLLRSARESDSDDERARLQSAIDALARQLQALAKYPLAESASPLDDVRGLEGIAAQTYKEAGVHEQDIAMTKFWQNDDIVWSEGIKEMHLVIKDNSGGSGHAHKRPDHEKFFPTRIRMTLIQVSADAKYDPKLVPNLPPAGEKK